MKITFDEVLSKKDWIHKELMNSLTGEIIMKAREDQFYEVKLLVNGIELEPVLFNKLIGNIDIYIADEAKSLAMEDIRLISQKIYSLERILDKAKQSIINEFKLEE